MTIQQTFNDVYADNISIPDDVSQEDMDALYKRRNLNWKADETVSLEVAAELYDSIDEYNDFNLGSKMIGELQKQFPGESITVTPAREWSVCLYLHIPKGIRETVFRFISEVLQPDELRWEDDDSLRLWWD